MKPLNLLWIGSSLLALAASASLVGCGDDGIPVPGHANPCDTPMAGVLGCPADSQIKSGNGLAAADGPFTVGDAFRIWVEHLEQHARPSTIRDAVGKGGSSADIRGGYIRKHQGDWLDRPLAEVSKADLIRKHRSITGDRTANKVLKSLRSAWTRALDLHEELPRNLLAGRNAFHWNHEPEGGPLVRVAVDGVPPPLGIPDVAIVGGDVPVSAKHHVVLGGGAALQIGPQPAKPLQLAGKVLGSHLPAVGHVHRGHLDALHLR